MIKLKNINSPDELSLSKNYKNKVLELNSFLINLKKKKKKLILKTNQKKLKKNKIQKINYNEE